MKKKIDRLSELVNNYIIDETITFNQFINCFGHIIEKKITSPHFYDTKMPLLRRDGTKYINEEICTIILNLKKKERIKIKRILPKSQTNNRIMFFYHIELDELNKEISKEIRFKHFAMYGFRLDYTIYHFLYEMRKIIPNLLIDIEIMLYRSA